jgi:WD40 repeat protein
MGLYEPGLRSIMAKARVKVEKSMKRQRKTKVRDIVLAVGALAAIVGTSISAPTYADPLPTAAAPKAKASAKQRPKAATRSAAPKRALPKPATTRAAQPQVPVMLPSFSFKFPTLPNAAYPRVNSVDLSPSGGFAVAGSDDGMVRLVDLASGLVMQTMHDNRKSLVGSSPFQSPSRAVAFSPNGNFIASGSYPGVAIFDVSTGTVVRSYPRTSYTNALAYSPDGQKIAAGSAGVQLPANYPGSIEILDVNSWSNLISIPVPNGGVRALSFSPDGQSIAAARVNGEVAIFDVNSGQLKMSFGNIALDYIMSVAFSPDGRTIVTSGGSATNWHEGQVTLWDVQSGQMLKVAKDGSRGESVTFSPDGTKVAAGNADGAVRVYSLPSLTLIAQSGPTTFGNNNVHQGFVQSIVFSRDSKLLLSGSNDQSIKTWRP